jgi:hypothetical protein
MRRWKPFLLVAVIAAYAGVAQAAENAATDAAQGKFLARADERFASADSTEVPSLQRHVLPLMGRLGCNGRACHGSFQGQGGFRLSLFGYDFKTDFEALVKSETPRVDLKNVRESMILAKTSSDDPDEHGGGKRMDKNSWQYRLIEKWIAAGAPAVDEAKDPHFVRMVVTPTEIVFGKMGETAQLKVVAEWSDGTIEDVTPLCRFQTNDDAVAKVDVGGKISVVGKGDTHIVAFYDNGVVPVSVMLPVSEQIGDKFPAVAAKTKVDELVLDKLKKVGIVPADVCTDHEFLRRASLDITGQLPSSDEVRAFLADKSPNKRAAKVDELLERPGYAAWWTTKLNDILGNSENKLRNNTHPTAPDHWYRWVHRRVSENVPYDDIVEGILLATGRSSEGQTFEEYCKEMTGYVRKDNPTDFTERETMPYYWMRQNMRTANEKALSVSYAFLGVRLQCAECHKHPFDQWSQQDFQQFTAFFNRVISGPSRDREAYAKLLAEAKIDPKDYDNGNKLRQVLEQAAVQGKVVPFNELFINAGNGQRRGNKDKGKAVAGRVITPKVLGGEEVVEQYDDPRAPIMDWLRQKDNPYFARSFVNRVWAHYFNVGIVEPADDMNLANAPSNKELLDYLSDAFIENGYDMKWLMREIVNSDTYQRSWQTNSTNEYDLRNFSHAVMRRLPAEVVFDAVVSATAGKEEFAQRVADPVDICSIGVGKGYTNRNNSNLYALAVFGKPKRETPCDCERSNEPSLLQTVYLRNDQEMFRMITRNKGWLEEALRSAGVNERLTFAAGGPSVESDQRVKQLENRLAVLDDQLSRVSKDKTKANREKQISAERRNVMKEIRLAKDEQRSDKKPKQPAEKPAVTLTPEQLIEEAYLRTFGRYPNAEEKKNGMEYIQGSADLASGLRDLVWALLNSKEFVVNH